MTQKREYHVTLTLDENNEPAYQMPGERPWPLSETDVVPYAIAERLEALVEESAKRNAVLDQIYQALLKLQVR